MSVEETTVPSTGEVAHYHVQKLMMDWYEPTGLSGRAARTAAAKRSILSNTMGRVLPEMIAQADRKEVHISSQVWQAMHTVDELDEGLHWFERNVTEPSKTSHTLWEHRPFPTLLPGPLFFPNLVGRAVKKDRARDHRDPNKDQIESATAEYLKYDWYSEHLDWVIVDALVFWECQAFITTRLSGSIWARRFMAASYAVMFGIIGGVLYWLFGVTWSLPNWSASVWIIVALLAYHYVDGRWMTKWMNRKIVGAMWDGYRALQLEGSVLSPTRVREKLRAAEEDGVVWPNMIWPVLDRVIARNAAVWKVW